MNFGTWNIQGIRTKIDKVLKEIKRFKIDVTVITETKNQKKRFCPILSQDIADRIRVKKEKKDFVQFYSGVGKDIRG